MRFVNRQVRSLFLAVAAVLLSACSKKPEQEIMPKSSDTSSKTRDTLSVTFDTLTDMRDGKIYKTVKIGELVWMAENLNYKPETGNSWCYNDSDSYCNKYGRLYTWEAATSVCQLIGWRLPTRADWKELVSAVGGSLIAGRKLLKVKNGWNDNGNDTDEYGFSALPGGIRFFNGYFSDAGFDYDYAGNIGFWWTATAYDVNFAHYHRMYYNSDTVSEDLNYKNSALSVRCVRDD
jgi:uncharacterized protein (TIGR02145 family)